MKEEGVGGVGAPIGATAPPPLPPQQHHRHHHRRGLAEREGTITIAHQHPPFPTATPRPSLFPANRVAPGSQTMQLLALFCH